MAQELNIEQKLNDLLVSRDFHPELTGKDGRPSNADEAKTFTFDYVSSAGKNYGTMVIVLANDNEMKVMYGDNLGKTMEGNDKQEFFDFIQALHQFAVRNFWTYSSEDLSKLKYVQAGMAAIKEGLFEGYYGNRRVSYTGEPTEARMMIRHNRVLGENDARFRYVESIYIETADQERFRLPFTNMTGARAMLEHVRQGGRPYDVRGNHIAEMVAELKVLNRFNRASAGRVMEGTTQTIVEQAQAYYKTLRESLKRITHSRGYNTYFEAWHPAEIGEHESLVEDIKTMFVQQTLDTRIEAALPLLARIQQQGNAVKEADIFESWINNLAEGTWATPDTPEKMDRLKQLMTEPLIVGADAVDATEQLYDLVGDDQLFDQLSELAAEDPAADARQIVQQRLEQMGIVLDDGDAADQANEGDNLATFETDHDMEESMGGTVAGAIAPLEEGASDYVGNAIEDLRMVKPGLDREAFLDELYTYLDARYGKRVADAALDHGDDSEYDEYYANYSDLAEQDMAEGVLDWAKEKYHDYQTGRQWNKFGKAQRKGDAAGMQAAQDAAAAHRDKLQVARQNRTGSTLSKDSSMGVGQDVANLKALKAKGLAEGGCNATMEGEMCPEHGLAECGTYESVAESRDSDALLARIKSLALIK